MRGPARPDAGELPGPAPAGRVLAEILDGGQCFRWSSPAPDTWTGVSGRLAATLRRADGRLRAELHAGGLDDLRRHLGGDLDWSALADALPWRSDPHLARCLAAFPGLRILRQPLAETLLCFLCSATKQIVQIRRMVALLAERFGDELAPGVHALPTWARLARADEAELRACQLGFRARFIHRTAHRLAKLPGEWIDETAALPYPEAKARLTALPGVGEKIADCALLFGAQKLEAFPVDVWLLRAMGRHYGLGGWTPAQVAHFGRVHFGPHAGLAQQYLFAWERGFSAAGTDAAEAARAGDQSWPTNEGAGDEPQPTKEGAGGEPRPTDEGAGDAPRPTTVRAEELGPVAGFASSAVGRALRPAPVSALPSRGPGSGALRRGRVSLPGATYFLTLCARRPCARLTEPEIFAALVLEIGALADDGMLQTHACVAMPDHLHLLSTLGDASSLGGCVRRLKGRLAPALRRHGVAWQKDGFFDHRLRDSRIGSGPALRYMLANPQRRALVAWDSSWPCWWCEPETWKWFGPTTDHGRPWREWERESPPGGIAEVPGMNPGPRRGHPRFIRTP